MGPMSNCGRRRGSRGMAMSRSRSAPLGRRISRCGCAFRTGAPSFGVTVNGAAVAASPLDRGYLRIERDWSPGDRVVLSLAMPVRRLSARPELVFDLGRVALQRGPFIYCVEEADAGGDVERLTLDRCRADPGCATSLTCSAAWARWRCRPGPPARTGGARRSIATPRRSAVEPPFVPFRIRSGHIAGRAAWRSGCGARTINETGR